MKATRFVFACLFVAGAFSLFALTKVLLRHGSQNDKAQVSSTHHITTRDVFVAQVSKGHNDNAPKTLDNRPDGLLSDETVAFANPASKVGISPSKELHVSPMSSVSEGKPNLPLPVGQKAGDISVSESKPNSPVSPKHRPAAPVGTTDETESNPLGIGASYLNNPEVYGQDGELLPSPEDVLARKAKSILQNYKDRKAEGVIISEEVEDEAKPGEQSLKDNTGLDSANAGEHAVIVTNFTDVASTVEMLANQNTSDKAVDPKLQVNQLLAALAEKNPVDVRLQAIYLLADVAPDQVEKFLDDKEDIIRCEAEKIVGIIPQD